MECHNSKFMLSFLYSLYTEIKMHGRRFIVLRSFVAMIRISKSSNLSLQRNTTHPASVSALTSSSTEKINFQIILVHAKLYMVLSVVSTHSIVDLFACYFD